MKMDKAYDLIEDIYYLCRSPEETEAAQSL